MLLTFMLAGMPGIDELIFLERTSQKKTQLHLSVFIIFFLNQKLFRKQ
jgi:hypothetical protein